MSEHDIYMLIAEYMDIRYPNVVRHFDLSADLKLTIGQAKKHSKLQGRRGFPDLQICQPIDRWHSFFLEIKKEGIRIVKRNGELVADQHIREQASMIEQLRAKGYWADFGIGFDDCIEKIDAYMGGKADAQKWVRWSS